MADLEKTFHEIVKVDDEIMHLLHRRVALSHEFYSEEAKEKKFHSKAEQAIVERIDHLRKATKAGEKQVYKAYQAIIKIHQVAEKEGKHKKNILAEWMAKKREEHELKTRLKEVKKSQEKLERKLK